MPILSICGDRGSAKNSLRETITRHFQNQGLTICYLSRGNDCATSVLMENVRRHDLVLVEDLMRPDVPVLWLAGESECPADCQVVAILEKGAEKTEVISRIAAFHSRQWLSPPILGCILIGGRSSRMGQAKHLISREGRTWLQRTASTLAHVSNHLVVVGQGDLGECGLPRLSDVSGCSGPLAGLLSAMRAFPWYTVLACACDMPEITVDALRWLLLQRQPGRRAVIPRVDGRYEPLLALYDFRIFSVVEEMADQQRWRLSLLANIDGVLIADPPSTLRYAWRNVNTPDMLGPHDSRKADSL